MRASRRRPGRRVGHLRAPASPPRRDFLRAALGACLVWIGLPLRARGAEAAPADSLREALESSPYVYVSPLKSDGGESRCHAEVWFAWLDGAVVLITSSESWKARALGRGLDRARIWVGNRGRRKGLNAGSEAFRRAPHFEARAGVQRDPALLERLLAAYDLKYPEEIGRWRERMRRGFHDGSRVLIRYAPAASRPEVGAQ